MTDTELLRQAQCGDMGAWRLLYARCVPSVWRHALSRVRDHSIAEDIVGETMLALVRSVPRLDVDTVQLHSWLHGVVKNKVADHGRKESRQSRLLAAVGNDQSQQSDAAPVDSSIEMQESRRQVLRGLEQLPELQRLILEWKHMDDLSVREISERTGQTEKSVESTLYRARKEFRRLFELNCSDNSVNGNGFRHNADALEKTL